VGEFLRAMLVPVMLWGLVACERLTRARLGMKTKKRFGRGKWLLLREDQAE